MDVGAELGQIAVTALPDRVTRDDRVSPSGQII
jgi:hypothetical protein